MRISPVHSSYVLLGSVRWVSDNWHLSSWKHRSSGGRCNSDTYFPEKCTINELASAKYPISDVSNLLCGLEIKSLRSSWLPVNFCNTHTDRRMHTNKSNIAGHWQRTWLRIDFACTGRFVDCDINWFEDTHSLNYNNTTLCVYLIYQTATKSFNGSHSCFLEECHALHVPSNSIRDL